MLSLSAFKRPFLALIILVIAALNGTAWAQAVLEVEGTAARIEVLTKQVQDLATKVANQSKNDTQLLETGLALQALDQDLIEASKPLSPRMIEINTRLTQLGSAPAEGEPVEAEAITQERQTLTDEKAIINGLIGQAETASILANQQQNNITDLRRSLFFSGLSRRVDLPSVLSAETLDETREKVALLSRKVSSWFGFSARFKSGQMIFAAFVALVLALVLSVFGRRLFAPLIIADPNIVEPSYLSRLTVAFGATVLPTMSIALFAFASYGLFQVLGVFRPDIAAMTAVFLEFFVLISFVYCLAYAILNPALPQWRLIGVTTPAARWLFGLAMAIATVYGLDNMISAISSQLDASYNVTVFFSFIASVLIGIFVLVVAFTKPFVDEHGNAIGWSKWAFFALLALGVAPLFTSGIGYVGLSRFISQQMIVTGATLLVMYIGFLAGSTISEEAALNDTALGRFLTSRFRMKSSVMNSYGLAISFVIYALVLLLGVPLVLLQWGFQPVDITSMGRTFFTDLQIGSVTVSIFGIFTAIFIFFLAYWLSRVFQRWLDGKVLARSNMDGGVRSSIRTAVGYLGIGFAGLVGISVSGFDLSNLAIVAGALSLGIGFGLQNIVSNFVSGLILLAERPFKEGDWVVTDTVSGFVKKVSVRATEIETFQRQTMIVPNSELINSTVGNWTHRNRLARIEILVGVAYKSDPKKVRAILLEMVQNNDRILNYPEPQVAFLDFGASSLDFEVRFFLADVFEKVDIETNLRLDIFERFAKEGIEFPFPQRDVNLNISDTIRIKAED